MNFNISISLIFSSLSTHGHYLFSYERIRNTTSLINIQVNDSNLIMLGESKALNPKKVLPANGRQIDDLPKRCSTGKGRVASPSSLLICRHLWCLCATGHRRYGRSSRGERDGGKRLIWTILRRQPTDLEASLESCFRSKDYLEYIE